MPELQLLRPFWLLALLPLGWLWWWLGRQRPGTGRWDALVDPALRRHVLAADPRPRGRLPMVLLGLGWAVLVVALAGPTWQRESRPVFRIEQAHVIVVDLSPSMDRADVAPTRLGRARFEVLDLLDALREGSTALIVYGAEPFLVAPLTRDAGTIAVQVPALASDLLPVAGPRRTDLALDMAGAVLAQAGAAGGEVLLITDGLSDPAQARQAAARLRAAGHRLSILAISADAGDDALAPALVELRLLTEIGDGRFVIARPDDADLARLLPAQSGGSPRAVSDAETRGEAWRDEGPWILLALLPIAAAAFRRGWLGLVPLVICLTPPAPALALDWSSLWLRPDQRALKALQAGDAVGAGKRFEDPLWRAAALYRAGEYEQAFTQLIGQTGADAHYNRGTILARLKRFEEAISEYDAALLLDPDHADARHNRDLLRSLLQPPAVGAASGEALPQSPSETDADGGDGDHALDAGAADDGVSAGPDDRDAAPAAPGIPLPEVAGASSAGEDAAAGGDAAAAPATSPDGAMIPGPPAPPPRSDTADAPASTGDRAARAPAGAAAAGQPSIGSMPAVSDSSGRADQTPPEREPMRANDLLLRQVPDDPAGLLRERLMLQYLRRHGQLR
jgi:Ca-activated chloride channel family protein